jgi:hypothetical protein
VARQYGAGFYGITFDVEAAVRNPAYAGWGPTYPKVFTPDEFALFRADKARLKDGDKAEYKALKGRMQREAERRVNALTGLDRVRDLPDLEAGRPGSPFLGVGEHPDRIGQGKGPKAIEDIWNQYRQGEIDANQARQEILKATGADEKGIPAPSWWTGGRYRAGGTEASGPAAHAGELSGTGELGQNAGTRRGGRGELAAAASPPLKRASGGRVDSRRDRSTFLYMEPSPMVKDFAQCKTCERFIPATERCYKHRTSTREFAGRASL